MAVGAGGGGVGLGHRARQLERVPAGPAAVLVGRHGGDATRERGAIPRGLATRRVPAVVGAWEQMHRREVLRLAALGAPAAGLGPLVGCGSDGAPRWPTATAPPTTAPFDPDTPWWLQGNFAPVDRGGRGVRPRGRRARSRPSSTGLYVRNGSNPQTGDSPHWFFGDGMVHGVRLERRQGDVVPQPLRAHAALRGDGRLRRGRARRRVEPEQRVGDLARRPAAHSRRGRLPVRAVARRPVAPSACTTSAAGSPRRSPRTRRSIPRPGSCTSSATASCRRSSRTTSPTPTARSCTAPRCRCRGRR